MCQYISKTLVMMMVDKFSDNNEVSSMDSNWLVSTLRIKTAVTDFDET